MQRIRLIAVFLLSISRTHPAPLKLCFESGFDLMNDPMYCPTDRNALKEFYDAAKGSEWTQNEYWMDAHIGHCEWYGVKCNNASKTIKLELQSNGLSGKLSPYISNLSSLEVLDLNNNDIKVTRATSQTIMRLIWRLITKLDCFLNSYSLHQGSIPTSIGLLSNLTKFRLSYNDFNGIVGVNFSTLSLMMIHLHGNRLTGSIVGAIPAMTLDLDANRMYAFISDCGQPSDINPVIECQNCTMCCEKIFTSVSTCLH